MQRALVDRRSMALSLNMLGQVLAHQGELEEAERLNRKSITLCRQAGDHVGSLDGLCELAGILMYQGKFGEARPLLEEVAAIAQEYGWRQGHRGQTKRPCAQEG